MKLLRYVIIALNFYISFSLLGALAGAPTSLFIVGELYRSLWPGPVIDSSRCAQGMLTGFCALVGGAIAGSSVGCYAASKMLFREAPLRTLKSAIDLSIIQLEWDTKLGRQVRSAVHCSCAGGVVIAFAGLGNPATILISLPLGFFAVIAGGIALILLVLASARDEITQSAIRNEDAPFASLPF